jgi:plasmid stabilization system protein ParE
LTGAARRELMRAASWYDHQRAGLGDEFLEEMAKGFALLKDFPEAPPPIGDRYRRLLLPRFPFGIIFRLDGSDIVVVAVAHNSRRPGYWRGRIRDDG